MFRVPLTTLGLEGREKGEGQDLKCSISVPWDCPLENIFNFSNYLNCLEILLPEARLAGHESSLPKRGNVTLISCCHPSFLGLKT